MCTKNSNQESVAKKVWIVSLNGEPGGRVLMTAFGKKEDAVAELKKMQEHFEKVLYHRFPVLETVDDLLILAFYSEDESIRVEKAVVTEIDVS